MLKSRVIYRTTVAESLIFGWLSSSIVIKKKKTPECIKNLFQKCFMISRAIVKLLAIVFSESSAHKNHQHRFVKNRSESRDALQVHYSVKNDQQVNNRLETVYDAILEKRLYLLRPLDTTLRYSVIKLLRDILAKSDAVSAVNEKLTREIDLYSIKGVSSEQRLFVCQLDLTRVKWYYYNRQL